MTQLKTFNDYLMRCLFLISIFSLFCSSNAVASCNLEWKIMKDAETDAKSIEVKINTANYEGGKAGNEQCRTLRQYIYLRDRHNNYIKKWLLCSKALDAAKSEYDKHLKDTEDFRNLMHKKCNAEKLNR